MSRLSPTTYGGLVHAKRTLGASWAAISGMTGVSVPDLRAAFDPSWPVEFTPQRRPVTSLPPKPKARKVSTYVRKPTKRLSGLGGKILRALVDGPLSTAEVIDAIDGQAPVTCVRLNQLKAEGHVTSTGSHRKYRWALTAAGRAAVAAAQPRQLEAA